jgi:hypothetical protein
MHKEDKEDGRKSTASIVNSGTTLTRLGLETNKAFFGSRPGYSEQDQSDEYDLHCVHLVCYP